MKITKENLQKYDIYITSYGNIRSRRFRRTFYKKICANCSEIFLARIRNDRKGQGDSEECCSQICASQFRGRGWGLRCGYRAIHKPEYGPNGQLEHRLIAKKVLGRALKSNEMVHHINGNRLDNRNCNLLICDRGYHGCLHDKMARLYMQEHF